MPLGPALAGMTALQGIVSLGLFAPGVLAPRTGLDTWAIGAFATTAFLVGALTAPLGGRLAARFGSFSVAAACAGLVAAGMALAAVGHPLALVAAGLAIGLAFGPETPASSALLGRLAAPARRPLVFSVRQTGNQIGAMLGSMGLPLAALYAAPEAGYYLVAGVAMLCAVAFLVLRPRYDPLTRGPGTVLRLAEQLALVRASPPLRRLALASMPWSMLQLSLNVFLVTFAVERVGLTHVTAGLLLATAQGGGLVGRLVWGLVAGRLGAGRVAAGLGLAMGLAALAMGLAGPALPTAALFGLALVFGLTASGWNGVFLAEVARLAPPERIAEATGAVLLSSYAGLVLGPLLVAGCAALGSLSLSYAVIGALAAGGTLPLLRTR